MWCCPVVNTALRYIKKYRNNRSLQDIDGAAVTKRYIQFLRNIQLWCCSVAISYSVPFKYETQNHSNDCHGWPYSTPFDQPNFSLHFRLFGQKVNKFNKQKEHLFPKLEEDDMNDIWFQQDGATCHTANVTIDLLHTIFDNWIIRWNLRTLCRTWPKRFPCAGTRVVSLLAAFSAASAAIQPPAFRHHVSKTKATRSWCGPPLVILGPCLLYQRIRLSGASKGSLHHTHLYFSWCFLLFAAPDCLYNLYNLDSWKEVADWSRLTDYAVKSRVESPSIFRSGFTRLFIFFRLFRIAA